MHIRDIFHMVHGGVLEMQNRKMTPTVTAIVVSRYENRGEIWELAEEIIGDQLTRENRKEIPEPIEPQAIIWHQWQNSTQLIPNCVWHEALRHHTSGPSPAVRDVHQMPKKEKSLPKQFLAVTAPDILYHAHVVRDTLSQLLHMTPYTIPCSQGAP